MYEISLQETEARSRDRAANTAVEHAQDMGREVAWAIAVRKAAARTSPLWGESGEARQPMPKSTARSGR